MARASRRFCEALCITILQSKQVASIFARQAFLLTMFPQ